MDKYDYLIVGSGAGGATLARELIKRGKRPVVIEAGSLEHSIGTYRDSTRYFDVRGVGLLRLPKMSREGVVIWRTLMAGGSTVVSCGNGVPCLEKELAERGVDIYSELTETRDELRVAPLAERLLYDGSREIISAAGALGYKMELMPKFIDAGACRKCGQCTLGCSHNAKWTALRYLEEARASGADVRFGTICRSVIVEKGRAVGVEVVGPNGVARIKADAVVIAAGGLGTPVILQATGIKDAGDGFFVDLVVDTYGVTEGLNQVYEPGMALVDHEFYESRGFILSPFVSHAPLVRVLELGIRGLGVRDKKVIGMMTKIRDESGGRVYPDGSVSKRVTPADREKLDEGVRISREILKKAGARTTITSRVQGGHPGGTTAIGRVVDSNLQTKVDNLFVCDCSVLPTSPGLPPILTIVALAKRLAKLLAP